MKNKWCLIMGILSCVLSLFGCAQKPVKPQSELTSVSIFQSHMDSSECFRFGVRVENNSYLLDAECFIVDYDNNDFEEINLTDTQITQEDFKHFTELDKEYDFCSHIKTERKNNKYFILDETVTGFSVQYGEDSFGIETNGECFRNVKDFFFQLAEKYAAITNKQLSEQ